MKLRLAFSAALAFISREENPNIVKLAWDYAIPVSRLWACYKEQKNRSNCEEEDCCLSDDQELALISIIECEKRDETELCHWQLQDHANWILAQDYSDSSDSSSTVRKNWLAAFLQYHSHLVIQTSKSLANEQRWSHDIDKLKTWFEHYKDAKKIFDIVKKNIWNYDETEFWVEIKEKQRVIITKHANVKLFYKDADDHEHLSFSEFIFKADYIIDSFIIIKR